MQQTIQEIDKQITKEAARIRDLAMVISFEEVLTITLGKTITEIPLHLFHKKGIYFFELKNRRQALTPLHWQHEFELLWKNRNVSWYPGIKKGRTKIHSSFGEWIPFYIGKSLNVGGRIREHIYQPPHKTTFSMKLNARENLAGEIFRISWLALDVVNYDMIAPALELYLRNRFNPVIGKQ